MLTDPDSQPMLTVAAIAAPVVVTSGAHYFPLHACPAVTFDPEFIKPDRSETYRRFPERALTESAINLEQLNFKTVATHAAARQRALYLAEGV